MLCQVNAHILFAMNIAQQSVNWIWICVFVNPLRFQSMKSWNVNWWSNIIISSINLMMGFMICHDSCPCQSQTTFIFSCVCFFRKSSLYSKLASQLSRGVLIDISCTNCDNGSSHCHIVSPAPGTWSRTVTSHEWRNVQCSEGGEWLLCLCLRSKTQAGAHWPLVTVPTQCTGETQETRAPGHERDAALVIIETPATGSLSLSCNIKC